MSLAPTVDGVDVPEVEALQLKIGGMSCSFCSSSIERALGLDDRGGPRRIWTLVSLLRFIRQAGGLGVKPMRHPPANMSPQADRPAP